LSLAPGDAAAIMGPSGSGKSTLLYILGALEPPSSGRITLDGRNPFELSPPMLASFRNEGAFCEALAVRIRDDVAEALELPHERVSVALQQKARGGITIVAST